MVIDLHSLRCSTRYVIKNKSLLTWNWASSSSVQLRIGFKYGCKKEMVTDSISSTVSMTKTNTNKINTTWIMNSYEWINIFCYLNVPRVICVLEMNLALSEYARSSMSSLQQHHPAGKTPFLDLFPPICLTSLPSAVTEGKWLWCARVFATALLTLPHFNVLRRTGGKYLPIRLVSHWTLRYCCHCQEFFYQTRRCCVPTKWSVKMATD